MSMPTPPLPPPLLTRLRMGFRQIRRNRVQMQVAPSSSIIASPHPNTTILSDKLRLNSLSIICPTCSACSNTKWHQLIFSVLHDYHDLPKPRSEAPPSPCPVTVPPSPSSPTSHTHAPTQSPSQPAPAPQVVTRSGRVIRRPVH